MASVKFVKLRAATLLETIIAMVIILVVFFIAVTIVVQTGQSGGSVQKLRAREQLTLFAEQTLTDRAFYDESLTKDELTIERKIEPYATNKKIVKLTFLVFDNNGRLIEKQHYLVDEAY